ncbi:MAG: M67 family metallopeptidase [Candidatus Competibacteraceae bacterium]|nr:M67 family metallopeptidase [Candidatus Competibacteraceae bacterium]
MAARPGEGPVAQLLLPVPVEAQLLQWAIAGWPEEVCGLLVGRRETRVIRVGRATWAPNTRRDRPADRYEIAPQDFLATLRWARERKLEVLGVWHTHPDHPAVPSARDRELAWPNWSYIIISVQRDQVEALRSWYCTPTGFQEQGIAMPSGQRS